MRFVFYNPHTDIWFKTPLYFILTGRKSIRKYEYLLDYCIERKSNFAFFLDKNASSYGGNIFKRLISPRLELIFWCLVNGINPCHVKTITHTGDLARDDVLFIMHYGNLTSHTGHLAEEKKQFILELADSDVFKVVHLSHYMYSVRVGSENSFKAGVDLFVAENNLSMNSGYFKKYFPFYSKNVYVLPFVPQKRFRDLEQFAKRKNKAVAMGTLTFPMEESDFREFFNTTDIHPMRRLIYDNKDLLKNIIDCYISDITEGKRKRSDKINDTIIRKIYNRIYNNFCWKQTKYFSFDIVDLYNSYRMFVVPEEINGLPAIGFVEGMACGCAYLGKRDAMYSDIGLKDGVHYIGYDGSLKDLVEKICYYQKNEKDAKGIAQNGREFVRNTLNAERIAKMFFDDMETYLECRNEKSPMLESLPKRKV